ncbi:MAG: S-adenosyl-l-methionine hydroxide adenosyltransferase family protein [Vampirovibrionales bacterium]
MLFSDLVLTSTCPPTPLTLAWLTDYGTQDPYAGMLQGVALARLTPQARYQTTLWNVTHHIPSFHIQQGAFVLQQTLPYAPTHTVFVCIVDPAVGSAHQAQLVAYRPSWQQVFIAPDNGLLNGLHLAYNDVQYYHVRPETLPRWAWPYPPEARVGSTFAGRDLYTPLACSLLNHWVSEGVTPTSFAYWADQYLSPLAAHQLAPVQGPLPLPKREQGAGFTTYHCHIQYIDTFGNLVTTLPNHWLDESLTSLSLCTADGEESLALQYTYLANDTHPEHPAFMAIWGSHGYIELAVPQGSAKAVFELRHGSTAWGSALLFTAHSGM